MQKTIRPANADASLASVRVLVVDQAQLQPIDFEPGVLYVRSAKGTGKTEILSNIRYQFPNARIAVFGHRKTLLRSQAKRLNIDYYELVPDKKQADHIAITIDSLAALDSNRPYDIVIIDESEQVISHFLDETMNNRREKVCPKFRYFIEQATYVMAMDADLGWMTFATFQEWRGGRAHASTILFNKYKPARGPVYVIPSKAQILREIEAADAAGLRIYVTSSSKATVTDLHGKLKHRDPSRRYLLVTGETNKSDADVIAFLNDPAAEAVKYDAIFASPAAATGLNLSFDDENDRFDIVFGIFDAVTITHFEMSQALARNRNPKLLRVFVTRQTNNLSIEVDVVTQELAEGQLPYLRGHYDHMAILHYRPDYETDDLLKIGRFARILQNASKNRLYSNFLELMEREGFSIKHVEAQEPEEGTSSTLTGKSVTAAEQAQFVFDGVDLSRDEYQELDYRDEDGEILDSGEKAAVEKARIALFYRQEADLDLIRLDDEGKLRAKMRLYEIVTDTGLVKARLKAQPLAGLEGQGRLYKNETVRQQLVLALINATPFYDNGRFDASMEFTPEDLDGFKACTGRYAILYQTQFGRPVGTDVMKSLSHVLRQVGLKHKVTRKTEARGTLTRYRTLDPQTLERLETFRLRRKEMSEADLWDLRSG